VPNNFWIKNLSWSVFWYSKKKDKWVRKRFKDDFNAALKFYSTHSYPGITLHVDNHSFSPPVRITEHSEVQWEIIRRNGKRYKKKVIRLVNLMDDYNRKGIWWCGYCIQLRRFILIESDKGPEMYCPVCTASHRINRQYNPQAQLIEMHKQQRRTSNGRTRRRRV
jgi:hypothetical protein